MSLLRPCILGRDVLFCGGAALLSLLVGWTGNAFRAAPLPFLYASREERLWRELEGMSDGAAEAHGTRLISPAELAAQQTTERQAGRAGPLVLDARAEPFYQLGHLPGALPLPRDEFRTYYERLRPRLEADRTQPVVIYCQGAECADSNLVAMALSKLGYSNLSVMLGGWEAWQALPQP